MKGGQINRIGKPEEIFAMGGDLLELGLDLPFPEKLKGSLKNQGIDVPEYYLSEEGMVEWLWTYDSKM